MSWERVFHGNASGIDAACAARGGCISFTKGEGIETVEAGATLTVCIGNSGVASSTKTMVEAVARLRARRPEVVQKGFEGIRSLVRNARLAIEAGDRFALGRLMDLNQMLLSGLFVSTEEIEQMCSLARRLSKAPTARSSRVPAAADASSRSCSGSGRGRSQRVLDAWREAGFQGFATRVAPVDRSDSAMSESAQ